MKYRRVWFKEGNEWAFGFAGKPFRSSATFEKQKQFPYGVKRGERVVEVHNPNWGVQGIPVRYLKPRRR